MKSRYICRPQTHQKVQEIRFLSGLPPEKRRASCLLKGMFALNIGADRRTTTKAGKHADY
ncbi:hypothetical protein HMPREF3039_02514 [Akkermansia sp. KLE1798]|nr:hypothetical protein HMPREF3039_02514 [Akkermansia sp. KLE1798]